MEGTRSYRIGEFGVGTRVTFLDSPTNVRFPGKWFVRNDPYACVSCSFMFDEEYALEPGEEFVLDYRVVLGDGVWPAGAYNITSTAYTLTRERSSEVMVRNVAIVMNGVTGRMGTRQHLVRSVLAIREQGGVALPGGEVVVPEPILVGRNENKLRSLAEAHGIERWSTDLDESLADPEVEIYFDSQTTTLRTEALRAAVEAGKHVYCEKPTATSLGEALEIAQLARERGVKNGVVQDKLFLPGLLKLKRLVDGGFFGRILSVRGEFGYWVFDGEGRQAQRPSWNYRKEEGGGIILDMLCHWRYVLDNLFGEVASVSCFGATHVPERWDENNEPYDATADDAAYATFELAGGVVAHINSSWCVRVNRDELFELQVDGTHGSAVAGLWDCKTQHGENTPKAVWNPDLPDTHDFRSQWLGVPQDEDPDNAFKIQWEMYLRHVLAGGPFPYDLLEGAKGVQLAELGLRSWRERRWLEVPALELSRMPEKETGHA